MIMNNEPLTVTAVITTYKREWTSIERAVLSVLNQTYPVAELLIVDDNHSGSPFSDSVKREAEKVPRIRYISMGGNFGVSAARNKGMEIAKGILIGFLDDDDEWLPDKIERQVTVFQKNPDLGLVFGVGRKIDDTTGREKLTWNHEIFKEFPTYEDELKNDHIGSTSHPLIRKDALRAVGGFRIENQPAVEDYELWIRIVKKYPVQGLDVPLYLKHMDASEHVSRNHRKTFEGYRNIYHLYKDEYKKDRLSEKQILRNITREGVKGKMIGVIPYGMRWMMLSVLPGNR